MGRILVVDDSALIRRRIGELLTSDGLEVVSVASGEAAVERAATEAFDLIVSDVRMGAMTGVQLCRVLRSDPPTREIPIVLLTASGDARSRFWGMHGGADAYLSKEGCIETLLPVVRDLLAMRPMREPVEARRPSRVDAAARVSAVMDQQLFEAVVAAEARKLLAHVDERGELMRSAGGLLRQVFAAPAVVLTLRDPEFAWHAIVARGSGAPTALEAIARLGLEPTANVVFFGDTDDRNVSAVIHEAETFSIGSLDAPLGQLRVYRGNGHIGSDDRATALLLADAIEPVARCALLVDETRRLARTDVLTGLANRRTVMERLTLEDSRSARYGNALSVLVFDVDHFKSVNDEHGHAAGDGVLRLVAQAIKQSIRTVDLAGRWGGEEFVIVLPECDRASAAIVAERTRARIAETCGVPDSTRRVTASCGSATRDGESPNAMALIERADEALYRAKHEGRDRVVAWTAPTPDTRLPS